MATAKDMILEQLGIGQFLLEKFTADLSDDEYFKIPAEGANHPAWIIGHIAVSEDSLVAAATGGEKEIAESLQELFKGGSKCVADAATYPTRTEIDELFKTSRARTVEALKAADESTWGNPSPEGFSKDVFPTMGTIWGMQGTHQFWHIGQLTVCRAVLKKPAVLM